MTFSIVPACEWRIRPTLEMERRSRLLRTPYEEITRQITSEAELSKCEPEALIKFKRVVIELTLPPPTVDLFHSGAGGYRAQFYASVGNGEEANRFMLDRLLPRLEQLFPASPGRQCSWEFLAASVSHFDAKIWIHEGAWLGRTDYGLDVARWDQNADRIGLEHRFEPHWAKLVPEGERCLLIKGGLVDDECRVINVRLKPDRSQEIHDHGYT